MPGNWACAVSPTTGKTTLWVSHEKLWKSLWKLARKMGIRRTPNRACDVWQSGMRRTRNGHATYAARIHTGPYRLL
jgi:hypothetical protein